MRGGVPVGKRLVYHLQSSEGLRLHGLHDDPGFRRPYLLPPVYEDRAIYGTLQISFDPPDASGNYPFRYGFLDSTEFRISNRAFWIGYVDGKIFNGLMDKHGTLLVAAFDPVLQSELFVTDHFLQLLVLPPVPEPVRVGDSWTHATSTSIPGALAGRVDVTANYVLIGVEPEFGLAQVHADIERVVYAAESPGGPSQRVKIHAVGVLDVNVATGHVENGIFRTYTEVTVLPTIEQTLSAPHVGLNLILHFEHEAYVRFVLREVAEVF